MAENLRDVPERYGRVVEGFHPRIGSYGRRLGSVAPHLVLAALLVLYLFYKRPAAAFVVVAVALILGAGILCWSVLKPTAAALTTTHLLRARTIGWHAVERSRITDSVFVERLRPRAALQEGGGPVRRFRQRGAPALWFTDDAGRRLMRFDGTVWDVRTLRDLAGKVTPSTEYFQEANVMDVEAQHPGLVSFTERHPRVRGTVLSLLAVAMILLVGLHALWPEAFPDLGALG